MIDIHVDIAEGCAAVVVGAKHASEEGGVAHDGLTGFVFLTDVQLHIARGRFAVAADVGVVGTAVHVASDGAVKHIDADIAIDAACQMVGTRQVLS